MSSTSYTANLEHRSKRAKESGSDSSDPSISNNSAHVPTSNTDASTEPRRDDSDMESELSESSEEPSDMSSSEDEDEEDSQMRETDNDVVVNLRANRGEKPVMKFDKEEMGPDIRDFLKEFLPKLKAANEDLEAQKKAGKLESLDVEGTEEGKPYIEMNLGLGVLEAKDPNANTESESEASDSANEDARSDTDILDKLMGREKGKKEAANIEVVQNPQGS